MTAVTPQGVVVTPSGNLVYQFYRAHFTFKLKEPSLSAEEIDDVAGEKRRQDEDVHDCDDGTND